MLLEATTGITTIDQQIANWFNTNFGLGGTWNWGNLILCFIAVILSVVLCGAIGIEREMRGRSAGLRTHLLVGVGSCVVMIISIYGFPYWGIEFSRDVARLAAGVIAGVGFLGAGAIIHYKGGIKGLTTAGTIWLVMAIGLACGSMNFILAVGSTLLTLIFLVYFRRWERSINKNNPMVVVVAPSKSAIITNVLNISKEMDLVVSDFTSQIFEEGPDQNVELVFKVANKEGIKVDIDPFIKALKETGEVKSVEVLNHHK